MARYKPVESGNIPYTIYEKKPNWWGWIIGIFVFLMIVGALSEDSKKKEPSTTPVQFEQSR